MSVSLCCMFWRNADRRSALTLDQFDACVASNNLDVVRVELVYQRARNGRGSKVVLTNLSRGGGGDAWMWFYYPEVGDLLAVTASSGWGPHNNHDVLYVGNRFGDTGVFFRVDSKTLRRGLRHRARLERVAV